MTESRKNRSTGTMGVVWWALAAVGAYYLLTDHPEHPWDYLPYILLMLCPMFYGLHRFGVRRRTDPITVQGVPPAAKK
jgi:hypothetical protein